MTPVDGAKIDAPAAPNLTVLDSTLGQIWREPPTESRDRIYSPDLPSNDPMSVAAAVAALGTAKQTPPSSLLPLTYVDDRSLACVVRDDQHGDPRWATGYVVRWHLDEIPAAQQGAILDIDPRLYVDSLVEEEAKFQRGYEGMKREAARYAERYVVKKERPKPEALRPFQLACQNVIIGLAAMQHEPKFNALMVKHWLTCEVPHVGTYEGTRALCVLMLCDAFQAGGSMEINFERHPEHRVPSALRRFGRTLDVTLGEEINHGRSISPAEARQLFLAVTPMPPGLRQRVMTLIRNGIVSAERLCYSLLAPIWRPIELDFILACSARVGSILEGGAPIDDRRARLPESEIARAALMVGMLYRRLDRKDTVGGAVDVSGDGGRRRVFDDISNGVEWDVLDEFGAVRFRNLPPGPLPWGGTSRATGEVFVLPRPHPVCGDAAAAQALQKAIGADASIVGVAAADVSVTPDLLWLRCPDRICDLDAQVLRNFTASRLARA